MIDFERVRRQADDAAREAFRRWEHCKEGELIAIVYPWFVRPAHLPISYFELEAAFKLSGGDFETATLMLRVSTERMKRAIIGTKFNRKRKDPPDVDTPVRWTEEPGCRVITVRRMPGEGIDDVNVGFSLVGDLVITIQRQTASYRRIVQLAERVLEEGDEK
jgi:hypothetical protein